MNLKNFRFSDISIPCLIKAVVRDIWMVIAAGLILFMAVSMYFTSFRAPVYQGTMTYAISSRRTAYLSSNNTTAANEVASVLSEMLKSNMVRANIRQFDPKLASFSGTVSASQVGESNFVVITVQDASPEVTFLVLQAIIEQFPTLTEYVSNNNIAQIIRNPAVGARPINEVNVTRYSIIAALGGGVAMAAVLCLFCVLRETVQTRSGARRMLDANIIASVNRERRGRSLKSALKKNRKPLQVFDPTTSFAYSEQINTICSRMEHEFTARGSKVFMITGVGENEGKSTIAGNVAAALAMMGKKVAIVDCDLRNPSLNKFFGNKYAAKLPLNQMLARPFSRENLLECMVLHPKLKLYLLCSKGADKRCTELISGQTMDKLLLQLKVFDFVILDTPPMGFFADAEILAQKVDATMLVVRQDLTPAPDINDVIDVLRGTGSRFLGCILNDMTASFTEGYGYGYGYGYGGYGYGYGYGSHQSTTKKSHKHSGSKTKQ